MTPYRTLVFARIVQESALSVGGNRPHGLVDSPLARDGKNRPVLRGSTLAGCFIASARAIAGTLPRAITSGGIESQRPGQTDLLPSAWRFAHAHLLKTNPPQSDFFQHVSIDARTQAAKDDHLFSLEALPAGTEWGFELEIVPTPAHDFAHLESLAAAVLAQWEKQGGARIGRGSRHGYGWCHLEDIVIVRLDARHVRLWPDAFAASRAASAWIKHFQDKDKEVTILNLAEFCALHAAQQTPPSPDMRTVIELSGTLQVGERQDDFGRGYGLDTLSIGGHARLQLQQDAFLEHVIPGGDISFNQGNFDPDFVINAVSNTEGKLVPHVPGSSIRGVWRAQLERHFNATGHDPAPLIQLFGSTTQAGKLSVADATLTDDNWRILWQQHVAIDELTGGAYSSNKFDRLCLAFASFNWRARIEADSPEAAEQLAVTLRRMLQTLGDGQLPLGGGIWRGHGHIRWTLDDTQPLQATAQGANR